MKALHHVGFLFLRLENETAGRIADQLEKRDMDGQKEQRPARDEDRQHREPDDRNVDR